MKALAPSPVLVDEEDLLLRGAAGLDVRSERKHAVGPRLRPKRFFVALDIEAEDRGADLADRVVFLRPTTPQALGLDPDLSMHGYAEVALALQLPEDGLGLFDDGGAPP